LWLCVLGLKPDLICLSTLRLFSPWSQLRGIHSTCQTIPLTAIPMSRLEIGAMPTPN
jgi:hypothetical protein